MIQTSPHCSLRNQLFIFLNINEFFIIDNINCHQFGIVLFKIMPVIIMFSPNTASMASVSLPAIFMTSGDLTLNASTNCSSSTTGKWSSSFSSILISVFLKIRILSFCNKIFLTLSSRPSVLIHRFVKVIAHVVCLALRMQNLHITQARPGQGFRGYLLQFNAVYFGHTYPLSIIISIAKYISASWPFCYPRDSESVSLFINPFGRMPAYFHIIDQLTL